MIDLKNGCTMMPPSIVVGTDAAYKIVHLLLIVDRNVCHVSYNSSVMVLPEIGQEKLTFQAIVIDRYGQLEETIFQRQRLANSSKHAFNVSILIGELR